MWLEEGWSWKWCPEQSLIQLVPAGQSGTSPSMEWHQTQQLKNNCSQANNYNLAVFFPLQVVPLKFHVESDICIQKLTVWKRKGSYVIWLCFTALGLDAVIGNFEVGKEFDALLINTKASDSPFDLFASDTTEVIIYCVFLEISYLCVKVPALGW